MDEEEKKRQEEKAKHEQTKKTLKTVGLILLLCGITLDIVFFVNLISSIDSFEAPKLFVCGMIGLPMTGVGFMLITIGCRREINSYMAHESAPVINEMAQDVKPAVKAVAEAVSEAKEDETATSVCPVCGKQNQPENNFCDECGASLYKVCTNCGARQDADDKFCGNCGAKLD